MFDRKTQKPEMAFGEAPGTIFGLSKNGWMDSELFQLWFTRHFLVHAPPTCSLLLLMDGHSTHFEPSVICKAAEESVILFCLPPNTTYLSQPLDKGCFGTLKVCWRRECQAYLHRNLGKMMTWFEFSRVFFSGLVPGNVNVNTCNCRVLDNWSLSIRSTCSSANHGHPNNVQPSIFMRYVDQIQCIDWEWYLLCSWEW